MSPARIRRCSTHGDYYAYSAPFGLHGVSGFDQRDPDLKMKQSSTITRAGKGADPRISTYNLQNEIYTTVNFASTTETLVNAAKRLVDELPEGTPAPDVIKHWLASAKADDAARGVVWPVITPEQMAQAGLAWHVFPNMAILQGITFALCYRARPYGDDPSKCIFESYAIERFPEGRGAEDGMGLCRGDRREMGHGTGSGFRQYGRGAEGHEVARIPRHIAQPAPGAEDHQFPPQSGPLHGQRCAGEAEVMVSLT